MNKIVNGMLCFVGGAVISYVVTKQLLARKCEERIQSEVAEVKEVLRQEVIRSADLAENTREPVKPEQNDPPAEPEKEEILVAELPFVIRPEVFDTEEGYDHVTLTYYAGDGVLTDEEDHIMSDEDIETAVGKESLSHFGEYEDDSVYVRNPREKMDYEILMDVRSYAMTLKDKPYLQ